MELSFLYCFNHCWVVCYAPNGLSCWSGAGKSEPFTVEEDDVEMEQCLVGKLISAKPFNKAGVRVAIFQAWNFIKELEMDEVDNDRFIFSFPSAVSRQRQTGSVPFEYQGLSTFTQTFAASLQDETVQEVDLSTFPVWVQVHGIPMGQATKGMAEMAARRLGEVLEVDFRSQKAVWITQFIRVKVLLDILQPLSPGFFLPRANRVDTWIQFRYEKITGFCYNSGLLGHMSRTLVLHPPMPWMNQPPLVPEWWLNHKITNALQPQTR